VSLGRLESGAGGWGGCVVWVVGGEEVREGGRGGLWRGWSGSRGEWGEGDRGEGCGEVRVGRSGGCL
jgi:hypothetical protein